MRLALPRDRTSGVAPTAGGQFTFRSLSPLLSPFPLCDVGVRPDTYAAVLGEKGSCEEIARRKREGQKDRWGLLGKPDHSELVRVLLWERRVEAAWCEAVAGGCTNDLWRELAAKGEKDHPEEVLPIYQRQIEPTLARTNNEAYRAAVALLRKVHALLLELGREGEFGPYLQSVRARFKMKRNFVKLLDRARWA